MIEVTSSTLVFPESQRVWFSENKKRQQSKHGLLYLLFRNRGGGVNILPRHESTRLPPPRPSPRIGVPREAQPVRRVLSGPGRRRNVRDHPRKLPVPFRRRRKSPQPPLRALPPPTDAASAGGLEQVRRALKFASGCFVQTGIFDTEILRLEFPWESPAVLRTSPLEGKILTESSPSTCRIWARSTAAVMT